MITDLSLFDDIPLFALLDNDERAVLAQSVETRRFLKNQVIFRAGDPGGRAYIAQTGRIRVTMRNEAGEEFDVDEAGRGDLVGMSSMLAEAQHMTTAVAVEDTVAIELDRNDLATLLQKRPLAGLDMMTMIEKHFRATQELLRLRVVRNPNEVLEDQETFGDRVADAVAHFGGSWRFIITFAVVLTSYTTLSTLLGARSWDPYPFILLNLFLSMLAAIQAPVIMMSQNRQDTKDRLRSELDYQVNLKAEAEISLVLRRLEAIEDRLDDLRTHNEKRAGLAG
ncbi:MAG: DUF1003 domain-containing protein [Thermoflexales bacterium]|nr:DUF1003 domain-containing protein [Thermoflexales bacterium]